MNLQELMNSKRTLGAQLTAQAQKVADMAGNAMIAQADVDRENDILADMQKRMNALDNSISVAQAAHGALKPVEDAEPKSRREMRASNEYARAFAYAIRNGLSRRTGRGNENVKILFDALTEGGGTTPGEDGGFLVPIDIDNQIRELKRELNPLAPLFGEENVTAPTGWRVVDTAPTSGMSAVNEMATVPTDDQPVFGKVTYSLVKYGLRVPVSNELLNDEVANLMGYLARWFAKKLVLTENGLLVTALKTLTPAALGSSTVDPAAAIKTVLNKELDPAISAGAIILTNQSGLDALDQLTDEMGRGLLQPDPTNATLLRIYGRRIVVASDAQLANITSGNDSLAPFFIGDGKEFATLFRKDGFEVASTDIGGNAWATDSTEVRGIARMCVSKFDAAAMAYKQLAL